MTISTLQQETVSINEHSTSMLQLATDSDRYMTELSDTLEKFNIMAIKSANDAEYINNILTISVVKIDHIVFKSKAYSNIIANNTKSSFSDHRSCNFGKWYVSEGKELFQHTKTYKKIELPHKNLHDAVLNNLKYLKNNTIYNKENTQDIVQNFTNMERASEELFDLLGVMIKE